MISLETILKNKITSTAITANAGIYFLVRGETVVYIGSSRNVLPRIAAHKKDKVFDSYFIVEANEDDLLNIETEYIAEFTPEYNRVLPNCERFKYMGQVEVAENKKGYIEAVIIGGKLYADSKFELLTFENIQQCQF